MSVAKWESCVRACAHVHAYVHVCSCLFECEEWWLRSSYHLREHASKFRQLRSPHIVRSIWCLRQGK